MVNIGEPLTFENWSNPWLMTPVDQRDIIDICGNKITAEYLWSLDSENRIKVLYDVFNYYRDKGFPYERYDDIYLVNQFLKLVDKDSKSVFKNGYISNSGSLCLDFCRHFCYDKFWKASNSKMLSIYDCFNDDKIFIKVLKNRMGWNTSDEDGIERPYLFAITDKMIRDGIRNSGYGYGVSNFRPLISKFLYEKYLSGIFYPIIFDYSAGWGARCISAASLGYDYYGIDPLTSDNINEIGNWLIRNNLSNSKIKVYKGGSEDSVLYDNIPEVDMCLSCPPYFNLEVYSNENNQSYNKYNEFSKWIEYYWKPTVNNCNHILKKGGYFVLIIKDYFGNLPLKESMCNTIDMFGMKMIDVYQYKTSTNHLSSKAKSGKTQKNNEYVLVYKK